MIPLVIECSDHSFAPYSFLCNHLIDNPKQFWVSMDVQDGREVENDYLCSECADSFEHGDELAEVLIPICINCTRQLRSQSENLCENL